MGPCCVNRDITSHQSKNLEAPPLQAQHAAGGYSNSQILSQLLERFFRWEEETLSYFFIVSAIEGSYQEVEEESN